MQAYSTFEQMAVEAENVEKYLKRHCCIFYEKELINEYNLSGKQAAEFLKLAHLDAVSDMIGHMT